MNLIFGASGHASEVEWLAGECTAQNGQTIFCVDHFVVEDSCRQTEHVGLFVLTETQVAQKDVGFNGFIALGGSGFREKIWRKFSKPSVLWPTLVHPSVIFDSRPGRIDVGQGCFIFPGCVLTTNITIGNHVHVNVGCSISHDVQISDFCTLSPGVRLAGRVRLAEHVFLGIGAVVLDNVNICSNVLVGAGAVVVRDIVDPGTYVGIPAKKIKQIEG